MSITTVLVVWLLTGLAVVESAGCDFRSNAASVGSELVGMVGSKGNERTLEAVLGLTGFPGVFDATTGYTVVYVSTDAGGLAQGDDDNAGTIVAPLRSLMAVDRLVETTCKIHVYFDTNGPARDGWNDLNAGTADTSDLSGKLSDGSLGPPPNDCSNADTAAAALSPADAAQRFELDLRNFPLGPSQEGCALNNDPEWDCSHDNDGVFFGFQKCLDPPMCARNQAKDSGWLWVIASPNEQVEGEYALHVARPGGKRLYRRWLLRTRVPVRG